LDTKQANSKYYNPYTFDPQHADYQKDVRLSVRDELPDELDASDVAESMYAYMFMTEMTWSPFFAGTWGAWEPDVLLSIINFHLARYPLPMGKRSSLTKVQRRACS
jgi:hypothetical protein